jgi:hypothetical protein
MELGVPGSDPLLNFDQVEGCPLGVSLDRSVDLVWGDLAAISVAAGHVSLGAVIQVSCGGTVEGYLYDSYRPDPGTVDFVLVHETRVADYGHSTAGEPRLAGSGDCP